MIIVPEVGLVCPSVCLSIIYLAIIYLSSIYLLTLNILRLFQANIKKEPAFILGLWNGR